MEGEAHEKVSPLSSHLDPSDGRQDEASTSRTTSSGGALRDGAARSADQGRTPSSPDRERALLSPPSAGSSSATTYLRSGPALPLRRRRRPGRQVGLTRSRPSSDVGGGRAGWRLPSCGAKVE